MRNSNVFTRSDSYNMEYCCTVVRIGECFPIEGKDKIQRTVVNGENIVISKDIKEGDIMFYASNETQLNKEFLAANNLFSADCCEFNENALLVTPIVDANRNIRKNVDGYTKRYKKIESLYKVINDYKSKEANEEDTKNYEKAKADIVKYLDNKPLQNNKKVITSLANETKTELDILIKEGNKTIEENLAIIRSKTGFFNKHGRVRAIRLGGVLSMGFLFTIDDLAKWCPEVKDVNLDELVDTDFNTVNGQEFIKAYVPYVPEPTAKKTREERRNSKAEKFDRMVKGEFAFHYDTSPLARCMQNISPTDVVTISRKVHGTSLVVGNLRVKVPIKLPFFKRVLNKFIDITGLFKNKRFIDYEIGYGNVTSSRTVIKNKYINKKVNGGYYGVDVWSEYGDLIYPYLDEGMTVYGEIVGYLTNKDAMVQKGYDYGCYVGENKVMPYRITKNNPDGTRTEFSVIEVKEWTEKLIAEHPEIAKRVMVIDVLYHGTLQNLYPDLSITDHWHENVLDRMRKDVEHFNMEQNEVYCFNKVPAEGVVLRKFDDPIAEAFKLKCYKFLDRERAEIDNGNVDTEMIVQVEDEAEN